MIPSFVPVVVIATLLYFGITIVLFTWSWSWTGVFTGRGLNDEEIAALIILWPISAPILLVVYFISGMYHVFFKRN